MSSPTRPGVALPCAPMPELPRRQHGFAAARRLLNGHEVLDPSTFAPSAAEAIAKAQAYDSQQAKALLGQPQLSRYARVLRVVLEPVYVASDDEKIGE